MKYKIASLLSLLLIAFLFQNFLPSFKQYISLSPKDMSISQKFHKYDSKTNTYLFNVFDTRYKNTSHEAKVQGEGELPYTQIFSRIGADPKLVVSINNNMKNIISSDRSEIRVKNTTSYFDQFYYSSFKIYVPADSDTIHNNANEQTWGLIWQCQQVNHPKSINPPLGLHLENDTLSVVTITDYRLRSDDKNFRDEQPITTLQPNKWYNVLLRYRLGQNGSFAVWIDGQKIPLNADYNPKKLVETKYLPIGYKQIDRDADSQFCNIRYGIYKKPSRGNFRFIFDDFKFGTDYNQVRQPN